MLQSMDLLFALTASVAVVALDAVNFTAAIVHSICARQIPQTAHSYHMARRVGVNAGQVSML